MTKTMTRRAALAGAAVTVPAAALATPSIASTIDPHPAWAEAFFSAFADDEELSFEADAVWEALPAELKAPRVQVGLRRARDGAEIPMWVNSAEGVDAFIDNQVDTLSVWGAAYVGPRIAALEARRLALKAALVERESAQEAWLREHGFHDLEQRATAARVEARRLKDLIVSTRAATIAGMAAQACILLHYLEPDDGPAYAAAQALVASLGAAAPAPVEG